MKLDASHSSDQWIVRNILGWDLRPVVGEGITWVTPDGIVADDKVPAFTTERQDADVLVEFVRNLGYEFNPRSRNALIVCERALEVLDAGPPPKKTAAKKAAKKRAKK